MSEKCEKLHELFNNLKRFSFPFDEKDIPKNGERGHELDRIVRVGTHTGKDQLPSRLRQHFINENKDRSIFRKNIGRAILNKRNDPYLERWELDLTTKEAKEKFSHMIDEEKQKQTEKEVSRYIQDNFSFAVFPVEEKEKRLEIESRIISTISMCRECKPGEEWLGLSSPKDKIRQSGLWLVNELNKKEISDEEFEELRKILV